MKKHAALMILATSVASLVATKALSHCQIPCGIFDDPARFGLMAEHITTIEKSIKTIAALSGEEKPNYNQIVRWVDNKEQHANEIQHIVEQYFMTQRIKPVADTDSPAYAKYVRQLTLVHQMLIEAMKCKQTTDLAHVNTLRSLLKEFESLYFKDSHK